MEDTELFSAYHQPLSYCVFFYSSYYVNNERMKRSVCICVLYVFSCCGVCSDSPVCGEPRVFSDILWPPLCVLLLCLSSAVPSHRAKSRPCDRPKEQINVYTHDSKINRNGRPECWISMNYSSAAWSTGCVWLGQQSTGMQDGDILGGGDELMRQRFYRSSSDHWNL